MFSHPVQSFALSRFLQKLFRGQEIASFGGVNDGRTVGTGATKSGKCRLVLTIAGRVGGN